MNKISTASIVIFCSIVVGAIVYTISPSLIARRNKNDLKKKNEIALICQGIIVELLTKDIQGQRIPLWILADKALVEELKSTSTKK